MRKTFCDRPGCGRECVNYVLNLYGQVAHTTARGERVGSEEMKEHQLCAPCSHELMELFGLTLAPAEDDAPAGYVDVSGIAEARAHP